MSEWFTVEKNLISKHYGDLLDLGGRVIQIIHTPGYSHGHCCFYEQRRKYLYSSNLVYKGCLYAFYPTTDPQLFYQSVKQVWKFKMERTVPSHHERNIPVSLINTIDIGFAQLERNGQLKQGNGLFEFGEFQIQI